MMMKEFVFLKTIYYVHVSSTEKSCNVYIISSQYSTRVTTQCVCVRVRVYVCVCVCM